MKGVKIKKKYCSKYFFFLFFFTLRVSANVCLYSKLHGNAVEDGNTVHHLEAVHLSPLFDLAVNL